jgi:hypothetical protein
MEILKLRTPALQNDEHFAFFTEFIGFVNEAGADGRGDPRGRPQPSRSPLTLPIRNAEDAENAD